MTELGSPEVSLSGHTPIVILTGFLGSEKTTLLSKYLGSTKIPRTAFIVNEYGAEQIDGDLVTHAGDGTVLETTTGCLCCSISGDVREASPDRRVGCDPYPGARRTRLVPFGPPQKSRGRAVQLS